MSSLSLIKVKYNIFCVKYKTHTINNFNIPGTMNLYIYIKYIEYSLPPNT